MHGLPGQFLGKYQLNKKSLTLKSFCIYRLYSNELDTTSDFHALYRQEPNKINDEEMLKLLADYRKPDKFSKFTVIPGSLEIQVSAIQDLPPSK